MASRRPSQSSPAHSRTLFCLPALPAKPPTDTNSASDDEFPSSEIGNGVPPGGRHALRGLCSCSACAHQSSPISPTSSRQIARPRTFLDRQRSCASRQLRIALRQSQLSLLANRYQIFAARHSSLPLFQLFSFQLPVAARSRRCLETLK